MEYFCMTPYHKTPKETKAHTGDDRNVPIASGSSFAVQSLRSTSENNVISCTRASLCNSTLSSSNFVPPTNQASTTQHQGVVQMIFHHKSTTACRVLSNSEGTDASKSECLPPLNYHDGQSHSPCLPVSKGNIKKMAQTRFVNSSPRSYRLMPASVESSDMTSFVEKSPHKHALRVSFMLDVAELWELSKHSELECLFTLANSDQTPPDKLVEEAKQKRPICHSSIMPAHVHCPWGTRTAHRETSEYLNFADEIKVKESAVNTGIDTDLLRHVKRFLRSQKLKEQHPMGIAGFVNSTKYPSKSPSHPRSSSCCRVSGKHKLCQERRGEIENRDSTNDSLIPLVKLLSVNGTNNQATSKEGQVFLVHMLPFNQESSSSEASCASNTSNIASKYQDCSDEPPSKKSRPTDKMETSEIDSRLDIPCSSGILESGQVSSHQNNKKVNYECFYCDSTFPNKNECARHMLIHLNADPRCSSSISSS